MKQFDGYETVEVFAERRKLPAGGYIAQIKGAKEVTYKGKSEDFKKLEIAFDIIEGEYQGFFADDLRAQQEPKKWKGVLRLYVPSDDGSDFDYTRKAIFKGNIKAVEESNPGYHWDWDENKLKGKTVGVIFREEEWEFNGRTGWKAQPYKFTSADNIRAGNYKIPDKKPLKDKAAPSIDISAFEEVGNDVEIPF